MSRSEFGALLDRSLDVLAAEARASRDRLCEHMAGHTISFTVDDPAVCLAFERDAARVYDIDAAHPPEAQTHVELDRATILELVAGAISLESAIWRDRFRLRGTLDDVARFHDGLVIYLRGAIRCPGFPNLLEAYRRGVAMRAPRVRTH